MVLTRYLCGICGERLTVTRERRPPDGSLGSIGAGPQWVEVLRCATHGEQEGIEG